MWWIGFISCFEIARISFTNCSIRSISFNVSGSTSLVSLYLPIPSIILSTCPLRIVIGVFNSWEAVAKKYCCCLFSSSIRSISCFSCSFAASSSCMDSDKFFDMVFRLCAKIPISSVRFILHSHVISNFAIRLETSLISVTGFTIMRLQIQATKREISKIRISTKGNNFSKAPMSSWLEEVRETMVNRYDCGLSENIISCDKEDILFVFVFILSASPYWWTIPFSSKETSIWFFLQKSSRTVSTSSNFVFARTSESFSISDSMRADKTIS